MRPYVIDVGVGKVSLKRLSAWWGCVAEAACRGGLSQQAMMAEYHRHGNPTLERLA